MNDTYRVREVMRIVANAHRLRLLANAVDEELGQLSITISEENERIAAFRRALVTGMISGYKRIVKSGERAPEGVVVTSFLGVLTTSYQVAHHHEFSMDLRDEIRFGLQALRESETDKEAVRWLQDIVAVATDVF